MSKPPPQFGPYRLDALLGSGGMGDVYRATDTRLNRTLAIKTLRLHAHATADQKQRFLREAKAVATLNHPNIVTLYDLATHDDIDYLVMEYVPGEPLSKAVPPAGLPLKLVIDYAIQIAGALESAHSAGIVHRDIKPANAIVTAHGQIKLLDFGLAKLAPETASEDSETHTIEPGLTTPGMVMGTFAYMSPEQARGDIVDRRTDLFSFGALLYEMATGRRAFPKRLDWRTPGLELLPPALRPIVAKLLATDREQRYASATEVLTDLRRVSAPPPRHIPVWAMAAAALLLIGAIAAAWFMHAKGPVVSGPATWTQITNFPDAVGQPALSPDGRLLAFIRGSETFLAPGQVYVKTLPSGDPVALTSDALPKMSPAFSPDSQNLTYTAGRWNTWTVPLLGGQPSLWLENASGLAWPSSGRLFYSELRDTAFMTVAASAPDRAGHRDVYSPATPHGMAHRTRPSPDGKSLLVVEMDRGNWLPCRLLPSDGKSPGKPVGEPWQKCTDAAWDPSGDWMYFTLSSGSAFHIWRRRFPDGPLQQVTAGAGDEEGVAMFPDGKSFVTAVAQRHSTVWLHKPSGERPISLEGYSFDPQFTPDGKHLLYRILGGAMTNYDPGTLRIVNLESGRNQPMFPGVDVMGPAGRGYQVSPDGLTLAAAGYDRERKRRIWAGPLDRQLPPHMLPGIEGDSPLFTAAGEILFRKFEGAVAYPAAVHPDGSGLRKIGTEPISMIMGITPGGESLLVWSQNQAVTALPLAGGEPFVLFARGDSYHAAWSPDRGHWLLSFPLGATASHLVGKTYVIPLGPGKTFPAIPQGGFARRQDLESLPGLTVIDAFDAAPGPTPGTYAYSKSGVQRNLFQVPVP